MKERLEVRTNEREKAVIDNIINFFVSAKDL